MPIPKPTESESESEYVGRCIRSIIDEYDQSQAAAICYNTYRQSYQMKKQEEIFILQPRKSENRGGYLSRCSNHPKIKSQMKNIKDRMNFCLNCFNEYYKYWSKLEDFADVPKDTALGECIAKEKAKGFDYKEAYAHCASKVVVQPQGGTNPQVLGEDFLDPADDTNLLVEPVMFGNDISIDFDDTLNTEEGKKLAMKLIDEGDTLHIITRRNKNQSGEVYKVAEEIGIPKSNVHFTEGKLKWEMIKKLGIKKHIDNNSDEIKAIKENLPDVETIKFKE